MRLKSKPFYRLILNHNKNSTIGSQTAAAEKMFICLRFKTKTTYLIYTTIKVIHKIMLIEMTS